MGDYGDAVAASMSCSFYGRQNENHYSGILIGDSDKNQEGVDMLYLVSAVQTTVDPKTEEEEKILYDPELVLASSPVDAKIKAFARWIIEEDEIDTIEAYVLPFQQVA